MSQVTIPQALQLAVQHQQAGRLGDAESIYRQVLAVEPDNGDALYLLGMLAQQVGQHQQAIELFRAGIRVRPRHAGLRMGLGISLALGGGDIEIALYEMKQAQALEPKAPHVYLNLGNIHNLKGQRGEAIAAFRRAIDLKSDYVEARFNLANALLDVSVEEAIAEFERVRFLRPDLPIVYKQLADALARAGRDEEAIANLRRAIDIDPTAPEAHYNLGVMLQHAGEREEAIGRYRQAIRLRPDYAPPHHNLGVALGESAPAEEVIDHFRQMLRFDPGQRQAAESVLQLLHYLPDATPQQILQEHLLWAQIFEKPLLIEPPLFDPAFDRDPDRPLRVGFVSSEHQAELIAGFLEPLLQSLDRRHFAVFRYGDETDVDAELARKVAGDHIDILIDLAGHADGNRLPVFAGRPAPLQLTWLGYADTTGMETIDYRLTDALADPPGQTEALHTEKLLRLETAWCYGPPDDAPELSPDLPSDGAGHVTFGCFNVLWQVNPPLVTQWARLLKSVPNSRLILKSRGLERDEAIRRMQGLFAAQGIGPSRVDLIADSPTLAQHLQLYNRIDVALDTFPYHGATTTCEALWMGVPVVTLAGQTHAARVGASLLSSAGLPQFIADGCDHYIEIAAALADDPSRRRELHDNLRDQLRRSILLDAPRAARSLESALRQIWRQRVNS